MTEMTSDALSAAVDELERLGAVAVAWSFDGAAGWIVDIHPASGDPVPEYFRLESREFPPASAGHLLVDAGWMVYPCAHFAPERAAGWVGRTADDVAKIRPGISPGGWAQVWTAPVHRCGSEGP